MQRIFILLMRRFPSVTRNGQTNSAITLRRNALSILVPMAAFVYPLSSEVSELAEAHFCPDVFAALDGIYGYNAFWRHCLEAHSFFS